MKIIRLEIDGFKHEKQKAKIEFKNDISILYGMNGSGKTTILKILNAILSQKEDVLKKENVNKIVIDVQDDNQKIKSYTLKFNKKAQTFDWKDIIDSPLLESQSMLIGVQRGININSITVNSSLIYDYLAYHPISKQLFSSSDRTKIRILSDELTYFINRHKRDRSRKNLDIIPNGKHISLEEVDINTIESALQNAFQNVKKKISLKIYSALFETFALAIDDKNISEIEIPKNINDIINNNKYKLIEALTDSPESEFKHLVIEKVKNFSDSNNINNNKLFSKLLLKILSELEYEKEELLTINTLIDLFNSLLSDNKKIIIDKEGIKISLRNENNHSLQELSSGERHLLTFLTAILIDGNSRDLILIDEPEISLNIIWQEKLIETIRKMAPNTQLIIASHSQSIAQNHLNSLVEINRIDL